MSMVPDIVCVDIPPPPPLYLPIQSKSAFLSDHKLSKASLSLVLVQRTVSATQ